MKFWTMISYISHGPFIRAFPGIARNRDDHISSLANPPVSVLEIAVENNRTQCRRCTEAAVPVVRVCTAPVEGHACYGKFSSFCFSFLPVLSSLRSSLPVHYCP